MKDLFINGVLPCREHQVLIQSEITRILQDPYLQEALRKQARHLQNRSTTLSLGQASTLVLWEHYYHLLDKLN